MNGVPLVDADIVHGVTQTGGQPTDKKITVKELSDHAETHVKANAAHASEQEDTDQAKLASVGKVQELIGEGRRVVPITSAPATLSQDVVYLVHDSDEDVEFGTKTVPAGTTARVYYDGNGWVAVEDSGTPTSEAVMAAIGAKLDMATGEQVEEATIPTTGKVEEMIDRIGHNNIDELELTETIEDLPYIKGFFSNDWNYTPKGSTKTYILDIAKLRKDGYNKIRVKSPSNKKSIISFTKYLIPSMTITHDSANLPGYNLISKNQIDGYGNLKLRYELEIAETKTFDIANVYFDAAYMYIHEETTNYGVSEITAINDNDINVTDKSIYKLTQGMCDNLGKIIEEDKQKYVTTDIVWGDGLYHISLKDGFRIYKALLYDRQGRIINPYYICPPDVEREWGCAHRQRFGGELPPYYGVRFVFYKKTEWAEPYDSSTESCLVNDNPILSYKTWRNTHESDAISTTSDVYEKVLARIDRLTNLEIRFASGKINSSSVSHKYWFLPNQHILGIPYNDSNTYASIVGKDVSLYTYKSAMLNKHTLAYSEKNRGQGVSKFGLSYTSSALARNYYNMSCNLFVSYALGWSDFPDCAELYKDSTRAPITEINSKADVHPLDILVSSSHTLIVTNVINNQFDEPAYVCIAESTTPTTRKVMMTYADFISYYDDSYKLKRCSNYSVTSVTEDFDTFASAESMGVITYKGDRATFSNSEDIFILVDGNKYNNITLWKLNGDVYEDLSMTFSESETFDNECVDGWKIYNVSPSSNRLTAGKYIVKVSDTEYTLFEVLSVSGLSLSSNVLSWSSVSGGTAVYAIEPSTQGFPNEFSDINSNDTSVTFTSATEARLYVKGDYGQTYFDA